MATVAQVKSRIVDILRATEYDARIKGRVPIAMSGKVLAAKAEAPPRLLILAVGELRRERTLVTRTHRSGLTLYKLADKAHAWQDSPREGGMRVLA